MKRISLLYIVIILFVSCKNNYVHKDTGVRISFEVNRFIFPPEWRTPELHPHAKELPPQFRKNVLNVINDAFGKYPKYLISNNIDKVYVLSELSFYDVSYGGTCSNTSVYLVDNYYSSEFIEQTFHHEFVTILKYRYNFDTVAFKLLKPDSVNYGCGGINALLSGNASISFDYDLIEKGFLSEYASSCIDEDLSSIAEQLFMPEMEFWYIYDNYPVMKNKIKFVIDFYNSIDATFTEKYFRSIATKENNGNYTYIEY